MSKKHTHSSDLRGISRLTIDAIIGATNMAEAVNISILKSISKLSGPVHKPLSHVTSLMYKNIRSATNLAGNSIETLLDWLTPLLAKNSGWRGREQVLAIINGVLGDYLEATHNPLAIAMTWRIGGLTLGMDTPELLTALPNLNGRILVLAHGLCMSDHTWLRRKHDHGAALAQDRGFTPVYLHYNSGRHISINGREFAEHLESLVLNWPDPLHELVILGYSMGGMLARSAFYYGRLAGHQWPKQLGKLVFLGTPHHGAPLERGGNWFHALVDNSPYAAPLSSLGKIRSSGITDLRYGNLLDRDWEGVDRFAHIGDQRQVVPLPETVACYTIAATTGKEMGDFRDRLLGDGLVPVESALGRHENPALNLDFAPENQRIVFGMHHLDLLSSDEVYMQLLKWL